MRDGNSDELAGSWMPPFLSPAFLPSPQSPPPRYLRSKTGQVEVSRKAETQASVVGILLLVLQGRRHQHFLSSTLNHKWGLPKSEDKAKLKNLKS